MPSEQLLIPVFFFRQAVICVGSDWKLGKLNNRLVTDLQPFMSHPYKVTYNSCVVNNCLVVSDNKNCFRFFQNVRDRLSSVFFTLFGNDTGVFKKSMEIDSPYKLPQVSRR